MSYLPGGFSVVGPDNVASPVEARVTEPSDPGHSGDGARQAALAFAYHELGYSDLWGETNLNHDTAMTYTAFWACVRAIVQPLAGVSWNIFERKENNPRFRLPVTDDLSWVLGMQASPEMTAFDFRQVMLKDGLTWGNGYAEIERTNGGRVLWLHRLAPSRVELVRDDEDDQLVYVVDNGPGNKKGYLLPENVFHLKGLGPDGLVGWSVVGLFRRSIQLGLSEENYGSAFFDRGPMPGGILKIPKSMTKEQRNEFRRSFEEVYAGRRNAHKVVVLSDGMEFNPASLPNDDAQFLESRTFQVAEMCRIFGLSPHKLADLSRATFANVEELERAHVTDCLLPWARRLESEADIKLFGRVNRGRKFTRLNLDALQRGNSQTQTDTVTKKVNSAILTVNEGREYFDLNPVEDGDTPLVQGAMVPLKRVLEEPPEPAAPAPAPKEEPDGDGSAARAAFVPLLAGVYDRLLRVEADKAKRADNKGLLTRHRTEYYGEKTYEQTGAQIAPVLVGFCVAVGHKPDALRAFAYGLANRHNGRSNSELAHGISAVDRWGIRPGQPAVRAEEQAKEHLELAWQELNREAT